MADHDDARRKRGLLTTLTRAGRSTENTARYVNPPVYRGSTVLFDTVEDRQRAVSSRYGRAVSYGVNGGANHHALEDAVAAIEGGDRCQIVSSGAAACSVALLSVLRSGEHVLVTDGVYGPTRQFCKSVLGNLGVEVTFYPPTISASELALAFRPTTRAVFCESPSSHTFEVQDVPGIAGVARQHGAVVILDNTWGVHHFQPFEHGVDISVQALTKYLSGHSDVCLGSVTVASPQLFEQVRDMVLALGQYASPDDCWLALRGARTLGLRLAHQHSAAIQVAEWLAAHPAVAQVLFPALSGAPGHDIWRRDFSGAASLFGVEFIDGFTIGKSHALLEALRLFRIGASWGGFESLALPTTGYIERLPAPDVGRSRVRLYVGLEAPEDLIADLKQALDAC
ncbi:cystathionine beta-lyase [Aminobacter sp. MSH1]|uniref:cystathionine beta-lyase n=1 Tax=Aminobacter sp. MSH1 TaxID=374606 RepID=UPI000D3AB7BD|nr:cystathionine beta-lyase [Aminobacter sp. MSH1]